MQLVNKPLFVQQAPCITIFWPNNQHQPHLCFSGINAAGEQAPVGQASVPVSTWQGPVEVTESPRIPVSAFAEQLLAEPTEAETTGGIQKKLSLFKALWSCIQSQYCLNVLNLLMLLGENRIFCTPWHCPRS